ncbi:MAG: transposase [Acidimicrobiia bacterium]|nr:transposase [Acidimicrobiia bacterium]
MVVSAVDDAVSLYVHAVIDHAKDYVEGRVHTNGMENFWALLKRMLKGTYAAVAPEHLFRYFDEEASVSTSGKAMTQCGSQRTPLERQRLHRQQRGRLVLVLECVECCSLWLAFWMAWNRRLLRPLARTPTSTSWPMAFGSITISAWHWSSIAPRSRARART